MPLVMGYVYKYFCCCFNVIKLVLLEDFLVKYRINTFLKQVGVGFKLI